MIDFLSLFDFLTVNHQEIKRMLEENVENGF